MCWSNYMAIPIVLKKPLKVYKVDTVLSFGGFISLYRDFRYHKSQTQNHLQFTGYSNDIDNIRFIF